MSEIIVKSTLLCESDDIVELGVVFIHVLTRVFDDSIEF